jgi:hypothetical protein
VALLLHGTAVLVSVAVKPDETSIDAAIQTLVVDVTPEPIPVAAPPPEPEAVIPPEPPPPIPPPPEPEDDPYEDIDTKPAEATKILTAPSEPNEPPAPREQTFATGEGTGAGVGMVAGAGEGDATTYNSRARVVNTIKGPLPAPKAPPPSPGADLSRPAGLLMMHMCELPDDVDVDVAYAKVSVTVGPNGKPISVEIISDPGHGLGGIARSCAFAQTYRPGRDKDGRPIVTKTAPIRVRFTR